MRGKLLLLLSIAFLTASCAFSNGKKGVESPKYCEMSARPAPEWFLKTTIYQLPLRAFTQEGTLAAATDRLEYLAATGVGCVYLLPIVESDPDQNRAFWSPRQKKSGTNNPCNPYRIKNYFKIDAEYGTDVALKKFVAKAHELGMKVMLDLVYYHCGPTADVIYANPEFVVRDKFGKVKNGEWLFPELNFKSAALRDYLISNMEYFVKEFGVDGYRADAEVFTPIDFWEVARERLEKIKPDIAIVAESSRPECQIKAYDANYGFIIQNIEKLFSSKSEYGAKYLEKSWKWRNAAMPKGARMMNFLSNHDTATDKARLDAQFPHRAVDAMVAALFALDGVPMLFAGDEIADSSEYSLFANKWHKRSVMDWSSAFTADGKRRLDIVKNLSKMRLQNPEMSVGEVEWLDCGNEKVVALKRSLGGAQTYVFINSADKPANIQTKVPAGAELVFASGAKIVADSSLALEPYGFAFVRLGVQAK